MLDERYLFNQRSIRSMTFYSYYVDEKTTEREMSFHVALGPSTERRGDIFPVYEIPKGKMAMLSDWSFNGEKPVDGRLVIGGSLGRITRESNYSFVLNAAVDAGEMEIYSPAREIRYLPEEWIAVCFHHLGDPIDIRARATFRFIEVPAPEGSYKTEFLRWKAKDSEDRFDFKKFFRQ